MESTRTQTDSLTPSQRQAVAARGNVLVMAGAGTGKTHTLVERCLDCLGRERASLDEILVVTFTEAAATEMKQRLRAALEATLDLDPLARRIRPLREKAARPSTSIWPSNSRCSTPPTSARCTVFASGLCANISTNSASTRNWPCSTTARPACSRRKRWTNSFNRTTPGQTGFSVAAQNLIQIYGNGDDRPIRAMLLRLHHYAQTRPDADRWLAGQITQFASPEPVEWRKWLGDAITGWRAEWLPVLENLKH